MNRFIKIALIVLGVFLLAVLVVPLLVPVPPLEGTLPPQALADPDSRFVTVEVRGTEVDVHVKEMGQGEPTFVLLHGFASSTYTWHQVMEPLARRGRVIAFDWMPYGLTERPMPAEYDATPYSRDAQVELTVNLLDTLGVDEAILIGNSAGGALAGQVATHHPDRVRALVLVDAAIDAPGTPDEGNGRGSLFGLLSSPAVRALGRTPQLRHVGPLFVRQIRDWGVEFGRSAWHDPERIDEEMWDAYLQPLQVENWDRALYEAVIAPPPEVDLSQRLDALTLPTLVVTGDDDRIVPTENSIGLAEALPNAELAVFEACGHVPQEECPQQFMDALNRFLEGLSEANSDATN